MKVTIVIPCYNEKATIGTRCSVVMSSEVETSLDANVDRAIYIERFDSLTSRSLSLRPSSLCRILPSCSILDLRYAPLEMTKRRGEMQTACAPAARAFERTEPEADICPIRGIRVISGPIF